MKNYTNFTLTIPHDLAKWLKEYKKKRFVSLSAITTSLLEEWRKRQEGSINE